MSFFLHIPFLRFVLLKDDLLGFLSTSKRPLIVLLGPTASGKTATSLALAHWLQEEGRTVEIVNADSRQLYRLLDIGTAKISPSEMRGIPHHLFSVLDPKETVSITWYKQQAERTIDEIHARQHVPILVGGSMLYVSAVIDGRLPLPKADDTLRERLSREFDRDHGVSAYERLKTVDPQSARKILQKNKRYVIRALEIYELTGKAKSLQQRMEQPPYDLFIIGLDIPRNELRERIEERTRAMLASGWIDEVRGLRARGYGERDPGLEATGYREIIHVLERGGDLQALEHEIVRQTLAYAKRQMTWWRKDKRIRWCQLADVACRP